MVGLKAETSAGLDFNSLDLEALAFLEDGICSPGAVCGSMQLGGVVPLDLETAEQPAHVLCATFPSRM